MVCSRMLSKGTADQVQDECREYPPIVSTDGNPNEELRSKAKAETRWKREGTLIQCPTIGPLGSKL